MSLQHPNVQYYAKAQESLQCNSSEIYPLITILQILEIISTKQLLLKWLYSTSLIVLFYGAISPIENDNLFTEGSEVLERL